MLTGPGWILLAVGAWAAGTLPAYREANVPEARRAELQRELPEKLKAAVARLDNEDRACAAVFADAKEAFARERVTTRLGLARRLVDCVRKDLAAKDVSSLCFAESEIADLEAFVRYFAAERAAWGTSPENPAVRPVEVRLSDFGAKGDGVADDAPAFRAALAAVAKLGGRPSVLRIPEGVFLLNAGADAPRERGDSNLVVDALTNCVVTGVSPERTKIRFGMYDARGLDVRRCCNAVFRNFEIRWEKTPFFEGRILDFSMAEGWMDVSHDEGTLSPLDPKWKVRKHSLGLHTYRDDGSFIITSLLWWGRGAVDLGNGRYRLKFDPADPRWKNGTPPVKGAKAVLPDRLSGFEAFGLIDCRFCTVDRVWCRNGREAFLQPSRCYACSATRCRIFPAEGRSFATNADGFYNSRGSWISDCEFRNMGDDGCNSVMHGGDIARAEGRTLLCKPFGLDLHAGDFCQVVESTTGEYLANLHVVSADAADWNGAKWLRVTFAEDLPPGLNTYETIGRGAFTEDERRQINLGLLKVARPPDILFAPLACGVGYVARRNVFRDNRNTAMVVQCPNALLEDNRASGMQNGMVICQLLQWNEGPAPYNVTVRGNFFSNNLNGVSVVCNMHNGSPSRTRPIRHLLIENNDFADFRQQAIGLEGADAPVVRGNHVPLAPPTRAELWRSVLNEGDGARLDAVFAKAERGGRLSVAALGGSITAGAGAGTATNRWSDLVADWFARTFPRAQVVRTNAGIGATGSRLGAHRIARDVAPSGPDFVTVDFSVNDKVGDQAGETMEGCVRQLLGLPSRPAVMLVSLFDRSGTTVQDEHRAVARHYGLPQLSVKNAIWPRFERGELAWSDYSGDSVHPNAKGHPYVASLVIAFLERRLAEWRAKGRPAGEGGTTARAPSPLYGTDYDQGRLVTPSGLRVKENVGFGPGPRRECWRDVLAGTKPGDRLVFETEAKTLTVLYWMLRADFGRAKITVDGEEVATLDGWFEATWGGKATPREIYRNRPGRHVVAIEIVGDRAPLSTGSRFELCAILEQK